MTNSSIVGISSASTDLKTFYKAMFSQVRKHNNLGREIRSGEALKEHIYSCL